MSLKYAIITGGSSGLGLHLAKALYAHGGFSIVLGCRNIEDAERAVADVCNCVITDERRDLCRDVRFIQLDLVCNESIDKFVSDFSSFCSSGQLHLLVNNAGIMNHPYTLTSKGLEIHFATNFLGHFVLTTALLNLISNKGRIINITSGYYQKCPIMPDEKVLTSSRPVGNRKPNDYYAISKLACCLYTVALHKKFCAEKRDIKVIAVRPGFVRGTELGRHSSQFLRYLATPLIWFFSKSLDEGIRDIFYCSTCTYDELESGRLYYNGATIEYDQLSVNDEAAGYIINLAEKFVSLGECRQRLEFD